MFLKYLVCAALFLVGSVSCEEADPEEFQHRIAEASNAFSAYLYQALRSQSGNLVLSPISLANSLAMLWVGAEGYSAHELVTALRLTGNKEQIEAGFRGLLSSLKRPASDLGITLDIANKVFIQEGFHVHKSYQHSIMVNFLSGIQHVDFNHHTETARTIINQWVENTTHHKIKELIPEDTLEPETSLILTNAMYFKGDWLKPFDETENVIEPFFLARGTTKDVPMMFHASKFYTHSFRDLNGLKVLKLPYSNKALSMVILLPKSKTGLDCLEGRLPLLNITDMLSMLKERLVEVTLPKFKLEAKLELQETLQKMGVQEIFGSSANLSGIAEGPLFVTRIVQKSFIEVSEKGTEAAAATETEIAWRSGPHYLPFKANHPFLFLIYDEKTQTILFMGRVADPAGADDINSVS